ncbi:hypothetical protein CAEBREN_11417 [Caenorhabditis brenneri]|uniref:T20D4.11-like domain-containing protein n=1 Tax=Caenorhabditis brenneri TaxID=135651 RepID=G0MA10_CAEBE|nr:hypothetical protein CAEBREN_11417 [Caenorhabditis brenneri]
MKILLILVSSTVIFTVNGVPTTVTKNEKCLKKLENLTDTMSALELRNNENIEIVNNACDDFQDCSKTLKRGATLKAIQAIGKITSLCDIVHYLSIDFLDCDDKLTAKNSTCSQDWNPFPDEIEGDSKESERIQLEACKNFFGNDGCLEKEIKELCDEKTWDRFKENYLTLNKLLEICDFD